LKTDNGQQTGFEAESTVQPQQPLCRQSSGVFEVHRVVIKQDVRTQKSAAVMSHASADVH